MITVDNDACWTPEAIAAIAMALDVEPRIGVALSEDDFSHVPTFGGLVDPIVQRT